MYNQNETCTGREHVRIFMPSKQSIAITRNLTPVHASLDRAKITALHRRTPSLHEITFPSSSRIYRKLTADRLCHDLPTITHPASARTLEALALCHRRKRRRHVMAQVRHASVDLALSLSGHDGGWDRARGDGRWIVPPAELRGAAIGGGSAAPTGGAAGALELGGNVKV